MHTCHTAVSDTYDRHIIHISCHTRISYTYHISFTHHTHTIQRYQIRIIHISYTYQTRTIHIPYTYHIIHAYRTHIVQWHTHIIHASYTYHTHIIQHIIQTYHTRNTTRVRRESAERFPVLRSNGRGRRLTIRTDCMLQRGEQTGSGQEVGGCNGVSPWMKILKIGNACGTTAITGAIVDRTKYC